MKKISESRFYNPEGKGMSVQKYLIFSKLIKKKRKKKKENIIWPSNHTVLGLLLAAYMLKNSFVKALKPSGDRGYRKILVIERYISNNP